MSDKPESVLPDEPSTLRTAIEVISNVSLQGSDIQSDIVSSGQSKTQVCDKDSVKDEDQHIPVKSPVAEEGVTSKEQAFQMLLNVLTCNYSDIPHVKAFKDSLMAAFSNQAPAQTTNQSEPCHASSASQQEPSEVLEEACDIADSKSIFADNYVSDTPLENSRLAEPANTSENITEQSRVLSERVVHMFENVEVLNPSPEPKIALESTNIQSDFRDRQESPKLELPRNLDMNNISMGGSSDTPPKCTKIEPSSVQKSAETVSDKDAQYHVQKETFQNTVQSVPSFEEHCPDEDDDDYEEYVTNDEMDEEDYEDEDEEVNEEIKLIMENIIAINESPKCSTGHDNILNLQYIMSENQLITPKGPEIITDNTAVSDQSEEEEKNDSINLMVMKGIDVYAPSSQEKVTEYSPHLQAHTANVITPSSNAESPSATSSTFNSTIMKAPIPPKRKSAKGIRNPPGVTTLTTSNNNESTIQNTSTELMQSRAAELERTNSSDHSPAFFKEHSSTVTEQVQSTALQPVDTGNMEKQDEVTSQTTDVSNKVTDQLQFEVSLNLLNPNGYVTHHQFNIQQLYALPTLYLCVLYLSENKQQLVPLTA